MEHPGAGDCPCKKKRVAVRTEIDGETGMLIDLPQQRVSTLIKNGTGSPQREVNPAGHFGASGDANGKFDIVINSPFHVRSTDETRHNLYDLLPSNIKAKNGDNTDAGNQCVQNESAGSMFKLDGKNQSEGIQPTGSVFQRGSETSGSTLEQVQVKTGQLSKSTTCQYVQNIQAIAENSYTKGRPDLCVASSKIQEEESVNSTLVPSPGQDSFYFRNKVKDATNVAHSSESLRNSVKNIDCSHAIGFPGRKVNVLYEPNQELVKKAGQTFDHGLGSLLNMTRCEKKDKELRMNHTGSSRESEDLGTTDHTGCSRDSEVVGRTDHTGSSRDSEDMGKTDHTGSSRDSEEVGTTDHTGSSRDSEDVVTTEMAYNLDDSGFIEMFSSSVLGGVIVNSGCGLSRSGCRSSDTSVGNHGKTGSAQSQSADPFMVNKKNSDTCDQDRSCRLRAMLNDICEIEHSGEVSVKGQRSSSSVTNMSASSSAMPDILETTLSEGRKKINHKSSAENTTVGHRKEGNNIETARTAIDLFFSGKETYGVAEFIQKCCPPENKLFHLGFEQTQKIINDSSINRLPSVILVQIFGNLSIYELLRKVSCVCKYWYNLCRDPDIWKRINLVNQHRLRNEDLARLVQYSDHRVWKVNLTDCRFISSDGIRYLVTSSLQLESLKVMRCFDITDTAFVGLQRNSGCRNLKTLYLDGCCRVTDKTVLELAESCPLLQDLHLNQCTRLTDAGIIRLARKCPQLVSLQLDHCSQVTDNAMAEIVMGCPKLTSLNLMSCGITDKGVKYLSKLPELNNVDLSNIVRLTSDGIIYISRYCRHLQCINISLNTVMDDNCVGQLAVNLPQLKKLYCVSCSISDKGLEDIANHCKSLVALDVGWCQDVTDHGVRVISLGCPQLEYFGLIRCDKVTIDTVEELMFSYPRINYSTFILESKRLLERARREGFVFGLPVTK